MHRALFAIFALALAACAAQDSTTDTAAPAGPDASGTWTGLCTGPLSMTDPEGLSVGVDNVLVLDDAGGTLSGTWDLTTTGYAPTGATFEGATAAGPVTGTRDGDVVTLLADPVERVVTDGASASAPFTATFALTLTDDALTGTADIVGNEFEYLVDCALTR